MRVVSLHFVIPEKVAKKWEKQGFVPMRDLPDMYVGVPGKTEGTMRCVAGELTKLTLDREQVADMRRGMHPDKKSSRWRLLCIGLGIGVV